MKLDMMLYGLDESATTTIGGKQFALFATGNDGELYRVELVRDDDAGKYFLYATEKAPGDVLLEADSLVKLFELIDAAGRRIIWDERRLEADKLIDEHATYESTPDLYAEAILDLEEDGATDTGSMREAFEQAFDMQVEDAL